MRLLPLLIFVTLSRDSQGWMELVDAQQRMKRGQYQGYTEVGVRVHEDALTCDLTETQ